MRSPQPPFLQTKHPQFLQLLLRTPVSSPASMLFTCTRATQCPPVVRGTEPSPALEVWFHWCHIQGYSQSCCYAASDAGQGTLIFLTTSAHWWLSFSQLPPGPVLLHSFPATLCWACTASWGSLKLRAAPSTYPCWISFRCFFQAWVTGR